MAEPRIGVALGGGGARGLAHIPMIEVLDEFGIRPSRIVGTSMGAFVGAGYAAGLTGREMRALALETFSDRGAVLSKLWTLRPRKLADVFSGGITVGQFDALAVTKLFMPGAVPDDFADLAIPFTAVATDFYGWKQAELDGGSVRRAVAASIAIPVIFRPVAVDGRVMVDGGVVNPLPFDHLAGVSDITIAFDVIGGPKGDPGVIPGQRDSIFGATQLLMHTIMQEKLHHSAPDILIRPNIEVFRVLDFFKVRAILRSAEPAKDKLRTRLETVLRRAAG